MRKELEEERKISALLRKEKQEVEEKARERLVRMIRMREKGKKLLRLRLGRDHEEMEVEALATMISGGSAEEGRKRLVGLIVAEERDFVSGMPVPALVLYRFLSQWGEFSLGTRGGAITMASPAARDRSPSVNARAPKLSFLLLYTISAFKALVQSVLVDLSMLSYCMSTIGVVTHLLHKELYDDDEEWGLDATGLIPDGLITATSGGLTKDQYVRMPSLDKLSHNATNLLAMLEDLISTHPLDASDDKGKEKVGEDDEDGQGGARKEVKGSEPRTFEDSPVQWFEQQLKILLGTTYAQMIHMCIDQLRPMIESAAFDIFPKIRASGNVNQPPKKETMESVIGILNNFLLELQSNFVGFGIVKQFFEQVFSFINAILFDALLLQKVPS